MAVGVIITIIIGIILLFVSMVLSALSASEISKQNYDTAHRYATAAAVVDGLSVAVLIVALIIYIYKDDLAKRVHVATGPYAGTTVVAKKV